MALPTTWGAYVPPWEVQPIMLRAADAGRTVRAWSFRKNFRSAKIGKTLFKSDFLCGTRDGMAGYLDELREAGLTKAGHTPRPSSYGTVWHDRVRSPKARPTNLWIMEGRVRYPQMPGAWQEAWPGASEGMRRYLTQNRQPGPWHLYDLRSAYGWAASQPMPDTSCPTHVSRPSGRPGVLGIYLLKNPAPRVPVPPPRFRPKGFRADRDLWQWVTSEEVEQLDIDPAGCAYGLEFSCRVDFRPHVDWFAEHLPSWKATLRAFWGRWWGATGPREVIFAGGQVKTRELPALDYNPTLAAFLVSRVALRVMERVKGAAHVYVDSVLTRETFPVGNGIGDWRLVDADPYKDVLVSATGHWEDDSGRVSKHAGVSWN